MKDSDKRLIQKAKAGNRNAFGKLVDKYHQKILYLAYDLMGNYDDAQDVAQEAFIKAFEKLSQFEERSQFSTWLYRITVNLSIDWHRKQARNPLIPLTASGSSQDELTIEKDTELAVMLESELEATELKKLMNVALNKLSPNQRMATILKFFQQKSSREIAEIMGCNENTVRSHVFRALANLRKYLKKAEV